MNSEFGSKRSVLVVDSGRVMIADPCYTEEIAKYDPCNPPKFAFL